MKASLFLYYSMFMCLGLIAQTNSDQRFRIFGIPENIETEHPGIARIINEKLLKAKSTQDVFRIINDQLKKYPNTKVKVREHLPESIQYYTYYIGAFREEKKNITDIKATRDFIDNTIYKRYQLKMLFADTIAILDTLTISIYPSDFNYKISEYYLVNVTGNNTKILLPYTDNHLYLYHGLFLQDSLSLFECKLYNNKDTGKALGTFYVKFLSNSDKHELNDLYLMLNEDSSLENIEIVQQLQTFAKQEYGNLSLQNIKNWLDKTKPQ